METVMINPSILRAYIQVKSLELISLANSEHDIEQFNRLFDEIQYYKQRLDQFDYVCEAC